MLFVPADAGAAQWRTLHSNHWQARHVLTSSQRVSSSKRPAAQRPEVGGQQQGESAACVSRFQWQRLQQPRQQRQALAAQQVCWRHVQQALAAGVLSYCGASTRAAGQASSCRRDHLALTASVSIARQILLFRRCGLSAAGCNGLLVTLRHWAQRKRPKGARLSTLSVTSQQTPAAGAVQTGHQLAFQQHWMCKLYGHTKGAASTVWATQSPQTHPCKMPTQCCWQHNRRLWPYIQ